MAVSAGVSGGIALSAGGTAPEDGLVITFPSSSAGDHLTLCIVQYENNEGDSWTTPTDWTRQTDIDGEASWSGADNVSMICTKIADAGDTGTIEVFGTGTTNRERIGVIIVHGSSDGLDVTPTTSHYELQENTSTPTPPPITTVTNDAMVLTFAFQSNFSMTAFVAPTNYTLVDSDTSVDRAKLGVAERLITSAGTETPGAWGNTGGDSRDDCMVNIIAIKPAAGGSIIPQIMHHRLQQG